MGSLTACVVVKVLREAKPRPFSSAYQRPHGSVAAEQALALTWVAALVSLFRVERRPLFDAERRVSWCASGGGRRRTLLGQKEKALQNFKTRICTSSYATPPKLQSTTRTLRPCEVGSLVCLPPSICLEPLDQETTKAASCCRGHRSQRISPWKSPLWPFSNDRRVRALQLHGALKRGTPAEAHRFGRTTHNRALPPSRSRRLQTASHPTPIPDEAGRGTLPAPTEALREKGRRRRASGFVVNQVWSYDFTPGLLCVGISWSHKMH